MHPTPQTLTKAAEETEVAKVSSQGWFQQVGACDQLIDLRLCADHLVQALAIPGRLSALIARWYLFSRFEVFGFFIYTSQEHKGTLIGIGLQYCG